MTGKSSRILVIDDKRQIRRLLKVTLSGHGYEVAEVSSGTDGLNQVVIFRPDLVILYLGLEDMDGIEVVRQLREWSAVPIVILSVREKDEDKISALDAGADDYVTKPFNMGELLARIRAALRHSAGLGSEPVLHFGDLAVDLSHRRVTVEGRDVKLTPTEYDMIKNLATYAGKVLTHKQLLRTVWGPAYENDSQYLRVYIRQLRLKIESDPSRPRHIITEPGVDYRLL